MRIDLSPTNLRGVAAVALTLAATPLAAAAYGEWLPAMPRHEPESGTIVFRAVRSNSTFVPKHTYHFARHGALGEIDHQWKFRDGFMFHASTDYVRRTRLTGSFFDAPPPVRIWYDLENVRAFYAGRVPEGRVESDARFRRTGTAAVAGLRGEEWEDEAVSVETDVEIDEALLRCPEVE